MRNFLDRHGVQAHFATVCKLVHDCFPDLAGLEVALQADPDEEGRMLAVVCAMLPAYPDDRLQAALRRLHARFVAEIPLIHCPLFALVTEFMPE